MAAPIDRRGVEEHIGGATRTRTSTAGRLLDARSPEPDLGPFIGRFEVLRLLRRSRSGVEYAARDTELGRHVALKLLRSDPLDASLLELFRAEAEAAAKLNHPNVVTIHDHGSDEGVPFLVLELVSGETLARRVERGPLAPAETVAIATQVCRGLAHAHARGVIHGALQPGNVLLRDDGQVKVEGFGLARVERALSRSGGAAPDSGTDVQACGALLRAMLGGQPPLGTVSPALIAIADRALAPEPGDRFPGAQALLDALLEVDHLGPPPAGAPYRYLEHFTEADAAWFFGRAQEVLRLEQMLARRPLVALVGHSGAGKSSLVHAGLVPRLRREGRWTVVTMRPGGEPLARLHERLVEVCGEEPVARSLPDAEALVDSPGRAGLLLRRHARERGGSILLVVDQLEEVRTNGAARQVRRAFAQAVLSIADDPAGPLRVLVILRDDFLARLTKNADVREALVRNMCLLGPPDAGGLAEALRAPAARLGFAFEPGLVEAIAGAVAEEPAPLPLLQLAASRLWERRDVAARRLTRAGLDAAGGVEGILAAHANEILDRLPDVGVARRVLCDLVTEEGTRRRLRREELCDRFPDPKVAGRVLEQLVAGRLVSAYRAEHGEWVELAHESLIAGWAELRGWLDEDRAGRQLRERLRAAAALWAERGRPEELLWRGDTLDETLRWRRRSQDLLGQTEQEFLARCEARLRRARRLRRGLFVAAAAIAVAGTVTSIAAARAYRAAAREARLRELLRRAAAADDPLLGALLVAELAGQPEPPGGLAAAVQVAARPTPLVEYRGHRGLVGACAWSPDDALVASAAGEEIHVWRADGTGRPVVLRGGDRPARELVFSPDGKRLASASADQTVRVWRSDGGGDPGVLPAAGRQLAWSPDGARVLATGPDGVARLWPADGRGDPVALGAGARHAVLSRDGGRVLVAGDGLGLWRSDGARIAFQPGPADGARFSPDGARIVSWHPGGEVRLWRADLSAPSAVPGARGPAAFSPDGARLVHDTERGLAVRAADGTGAAVELDARHGPAPDDELPSFTPDGERLLVSGATDARLAWADGFGAPVVLRHGGGAYLSHDGTRVLTCRPSTTVRIWPAGDPPGVRTFHGHQGVVMTADVSRDGRLLVTSANERWDCGGGIRGCGGIRLWPLAGGAPSSLGRPGGPLALSPDGRHVAQALGDLLLVWPVDGGEPVEIDRSMALRAPPAFSPDGSLVAAAGVFRADGSGMVTDLPVSSRDLRVYFAASVAFSADGTRFVATPFGSPALVWRTSDWAAEPVALAGDSIGLAQAVFHPRGDLILTGSYTGRVQLWSLDGHELTDLARPGGPAVAFSPDGERIATGLPDGTARITRLDQRGDAVVVGAHPGSVTGVRFTPDGRHLLTFAAGDPLLRLWLVDWDELARALRAATSACLLPEQRVSYLDESELSARAAWARCERRNGREP